VKMRGFLALLVLGVVVVYFIWFAKTGTESGIEAEIGAFDRSREELTRANLSALAQQIAAYAASQGDLPRDLAAFERGMRPGAGLLDGWGKRVRYEKTSEDGFRLTSAGFDGVFGTDDDIALNY
jgi:hypothetical protein